MYKQISIIILALMLSACASNTLSTSQQVEQLHNAAIAQRQESVEMIFAEVPSSDSLSNVLIIGLLETGTSSGTVDGIVEVLTARPSDKPLGVVGKSRALNVATLKRALKNLPVISDAPFYDVYIDASEKQLTELREEALKKNIHIYGLN